MVDENRYIVTLTGIFDPVIAIYHPQEEDDYWYPKGEIPETLN